jgi:hypothetical protein|tara:strand:+ start:159 stop:416 length:258 start_codon:yes stop_codon:yes gene_type:complete
MARLNLRNLLSNTERVEYAQNLADKNNRTLRRVKNNTVRDSIVYEDRESGETRTLPNKFIRALGYATAFELVDPNLDVVNTVELN